MDDDAVRRELAGALLAGLTASNPLYYDDAADELADALLPTVRRIAEQRAAEELRAIARAGLRATPGAHPVRIPVSYLYDRAAALSPAPVVAPDNNDDLPYRAEPVTETDRRFARLFRGATPDNNQQKEG